MKNSFKYLRPIFRQMWKPILFMAIITIIASAFSLLPPFFGKELFDKGISANNVSNIVFYGTLSLGAFLVGMVLSFSAQIIYVKSSTQFSLNLKTRILNRIVNLPLAFFDKQQSGYLVSRVNETDSISGLFSPMVFQFFASIIEAVGALIIVLRISSEIILLLIPFMILVFFATMWTGRKLRSSTNELMESTASTFGGLQEVIFGVEDLKNFDSENRVMNKTITKYKEVATKRVKQSIFSAAGMNLIGFLASAISTVVVIFAGIHIVRGHLTIGDYVALTGYSMKLFTPIQSFSSLSLTFQPILVALKRLGYIFEARMEKELWGNKKAEKNEGAVSFQDVSFNYDKQNKPVLQGCTFSISPGECVAILGTNGSGKSTIFKLMLGFYHDYKGTIYFNDSELHNYDIASLRNRIGIVSQNIFLFKGSMKENIKMANFGASEQAVETAIELSGCKKIFDSEIGSIKVQEFGRNLSGGQKQAAAIARCLLKDADLLLFDEATTHLDEATRAIVLHAISETFINKTRIIITHDRDIANMADRILLLEDGKTTFLPLKNLIH